MVEPDRNARPPRDPVSWMVHNRVTPNILMLVFLVGGLFFTTQVRQEVFPDFDLDLVTVTVPYPGASPEEVERGIILAAEEAVRGLDGVEEVVAVAGEGVATVTIELEEGGNHQKVFEEIRQEIDRITTLPEDAEEPAVVLQTRRREVLDLRLYGDVSERALRELAEHVRDRLLQYPGLTQVDLVGAREYEIHIEVPGAMLRAHGLTLRQIAERVEATAVELPGGGVKTRGGEILVRLSERRDWAREFAEIPIITTAAGATLRLGDIAVVEDDFEDIETFATYDEQRSIGLEVYRVGEQTPIGVSDSVRRAMAEVEAELPPGVHYAIQRDRSDIYRQRLELLVKNALLGLILVLGLLSLFLELRLAFWVTMGIPTSFLGALLFLPGLDVSINMVSMFAFIIALGIVVDDAIVAGENIYEYRQQGMGLADAAIRGARDVALPVSFSIVTNVVAFLPLAFVPGYMGKIWGVIPFVVSTVFLISWVEAVFILPAHLAHERERTRRGWGARVHAWQQAFSRGFSLVVERYYGPFIDRAMDNRYLTIAIAASSLAVVIAYASSGRMGIILMPKVESDEAVVTAVLPVGSPPSATAAVRDRLLEAARRVEREHGGEELVRGLFALVEENVVEVTIYLTDPGVRPLSTGAVTDLWRGEVGAIAGLESIQFESDRGGPGRGPGLTIELSHRDIDVLDRASASLAETLAGFTNVTDIDDGFTPGKTQFDFRLRPEGRSLGLTSAEVARQVRDAFYGAEALRQQRGRSEVKVLVHLPTDERASEHDVEQLLIRTPSGRDVPLLQIASVERGHAYTDISRRDGRRTVTVTGNVVPMSQTSTVLETLEAEALPALVRDYPGVTYSFEGRQAELRDAVASLVAGFGYALIVIYVLLAIPFRSYAQPAIVMTAIPFAVFGAIIGHAIMGYSLSVISLMGIVALSGVVVNDALVMMDFANRQRETGADPRPAIRSAGVRRFRPILLTTLTTFGGLAPMIFETSRQARFMIPMAISLGYGIVFATAITLVLIPCLYLILEDLRGVFSRISLQQDSPFEPTRSS